MYLRIMNPVDVECNAEYIKAHSGQKTLERIREIVMVLEESYGAERKACAMGGFVIFFPSISDWKKDYGKVLDYHHLKMANKEYKEPIMEETRCWTEELFLVSSEDSLVLIMEDDTEREEKKGA